jgi:hypothetical protein
MVIEKARERNVESEEGVNSAVYVYAFFLPPGLGLVPRFE